MKTRTLTAIAAIAALAVYSAWVTVENATLRRRMAELEARPSAVVRRPRMKDAPPPRPQRMRTETRVGASDQKIPPAPGGERISDEAVDKAVAARIAALKKDAEEARERRREAIASLTPEQKAAQRDMFLERMHERAQRRLETFVSRTGLNAEQKSSFENTIAAIDATLRETADAWAEQIRKTGTFTRDAQVKFVGEVSNVLGSKNRTRRLTVCWRGWREWRGLHRRRLVHDRAAAHRPRSGLHRCSQHPWPLARRHRQGALWRGRVATLFF